MALCKALALVAVIVLAPVVGAVTPSLPSGKAPGTITFVPLEEGKCGDGGTPYFGYVEPALNSDPDSFFILIAGGSICFNKSTCEDEYDRAWLSADAFFEEKLGANEATRTSMKNGDPMQLSEFLSTTKPGYIPADSSHPLYGRRGLFLPTCTGDFLLGQRAVEYDNQLTVHHRGALNMRLTLAMVKTSLPALKKLTVYGGSGGGVAAAAWMGDIATTFPAAAVDVLVDSGFLMFPGSAIYDFMSEKAPWRKPTTGTAFPQLAWSQPEALAGTLKSSAGRLRLAYVGCDGDNIVVNDRKSMRNNGADVGLSLHYHKDMFCFLAHLQADAPAASAYSYFSECNLHYISRESFPEVANIANTITAKAFVDSFLRGEAPADPSDAARQTWWFDQHDTSICTPKEEEAPKEVEKKNEQETNAGWVATPAWLSGLFALVAIVAVRY